MKKDEIIFEVVDDEDSHDHLVSMSDSYYHKGITTVCPYRPYPPSELLDFRKFPITESKYPLNVLPRWCVNNPNRLTELIRKKESDVCYLSEGLITTVGKEVLQKMFKKSLLKHIPKELCNLKISVFDARQNGNETIFDYAFFNEPEMEITPIARFVFAIYSAGSVKTDDKKASTIAKNITDELYWCGYNFSSVHRISGAEIEVNGKKVVGYSIQFEAKYSDFEFKMSTVLYHVTLKRYIDKIKTRGLVPSSKSSLFHYPERVYLFNFHNGESSSNRPNIMQSYMMQRLMAIFNTETEEVVQRKFDPKIDKGFYIIKILQRKLVESPSFKSGKLDFYIDACYDGQLMSTNKSPAIFTYNNIPASLIEKNAMYCPILSASKYEVTFGNMTNVTI